MMDDELRLPTRKCRNGEEAILSPGGEFLGQYGPYIVDEGLRHAANTAFILSRPLLLTGEPGCGKTDFAWVAANSLGFRPTVLESERNFMTPAPLRCQVRSEMSGRDLLYHYDALLRFVDSHHPDRSLRTAELRRYFELRGLGKALVWPRDERPVLLIDEIDKAPRDLPNDLLQALDEGVFEVAELRESEDEFQTLDGFMMKRVMGHSRASVLRPNRPFVIVTSNVEQQLPEPFLRRCVFYHIKFPRRTELVEIVRSRLSSDVKSETVPPELIEPAVNVFVALRNTPGLGKKPATSELLDWIETLVRYWDSTTSSSWIRAFAANLAEDGRTGGVVLRERGSVQWRDLPGLECLLKLRRDLEQVAAI